MSRLNAELARLANSLSMEQRQDHGAGAGRWATASRQRRPDAALRSTAAGLTDAAGPNQAQLDSSQEEAARLTADINALAELRRQLESEIASRLVETTRG
jgi:chemotaxis protein MotB